MDSKLNPQSNLNSARIIQASHDLTIQWSRELFGRYIEKLDEKLFNLAQSSDNNTDQSRYFQAREEIVKNAAIIERIYFERLSLAFDHYRSNTPTSRNLDHNPGIVSDDELSLVDKDELEDTLAIVTMSRKSSANCSELLYALNHRFSVLRGGEKIGEQGNPVAPAVFSESLQLAISDLNVDGKEKLILYKVFEFSFINRLRELYQQLNIDLIAHHILPNLSYGVRKFAPPSNSGNKNTEQPLANEFHVNNDKQSIENQFRLIQAIRILQARLAPQLLQANQTMPVPAEQVIASIAQLQLNAGKLLASMEGPRSFSAGNVETISSQSEQFAKKNGNVDQGTIKIVGMLFEYMLNEQGLPDAVKALLSYLHTPFLKIALLDEDFFSQPDHPARQLLNSLVAAGEHSINPNEKHKSDVFQKIKSIVQRLLEDNDSDLRLFSELAFEFNHYLRQHTKRIQLTEKRVLQAAQGETKLKEIRLKIDSFLKTKIGEIDLPTPIKLLLYEPWASYLSFNLLRFGSQSVQWKLSTRVVDDVIWYCQPHNVHDDYRTKKRIAQLRESLPETIKRGFETVGYDSAKGGELLAALHTEQRGSQPRTEPVNTDIDNVDIGRQAKLEASNDSLITRLKSLQSGTWFRFGVKTNTPLLTKLAWTNHDTLQFMFVNIMGQRVAIKSAKQLAAELRSGETKLRKASKGKPFFESAMERVLKQLQEKEMARKDTHNKPSQRNSAEE